MPRGRPRSQVVRPPCPLGHEDGRIYLHGVRAVPGGKFEKTRWRCVRQTPQGEARHHWTSNRRTPTSEHPDGTTCVACEHEAGRAEGPTVVPWFSFPVADAARDLLLVGQGTSLREASQRVRYEAGSFTVDSAGRRWASRQNALSADYLDQFGPSVVRALTPRRWPRVLVLDSLPLGIRVRDADTHGYQAGREGGAVLVAAGRERGQDRTRCWLTTLAADETADSWWEFLAQLDADPPPFWVVADGSKAIRNAVAALWPEAIFYPCEEHLRRNARQHATDDGVLDKVAGLDDAIGRAFLGIEAWEELGRLVEAEVGLASQLGAWWVRTDAAARRMAEVKHRYGYPAGNGPAERVALAIKTRLGKRTEVFRNAERLATVVALMGLDLSEQASQPAYSRIIRERLDDADWRPGLNWEGPHDYAGETSSLDDLIIGGWERADALAGLAMADAVSASVQRKVAAVNVLRLASGVEPLEATRRVGSSITSVKVAGLTLAAFPQLLAEWDRQANDPGTDPASLPAGSGRKVGWKCSTCGLRWQARVVDRTVRQNGCRACRRSWATETTSISAVCPEVVPEWDADANGGRLPERIKATSERPAFWNCAVAGSGHPVYQMSPKARLNKAAQGRPGCPRCRAALTQRAQRAKRRRETT